MAPNANSVGAGQALVPDTNDALIQNPLENADDTVPIVVQVGIIDTRSSPTTFWLMLIGGAFLVLLTGMMVFLFLLRQCLKRAVTEKEIQVEPLPAPISMITKVHQPQIQKEKEALETKEPEKIALP